VGSSVEHDAWALAHFEASERMGKSALYSWQTVAIFYTANQLVHMALAVIPGLSVAQAHPENHDGHARAAEGTNRVLAQNAPGLATTYLGLFSASVDVRYHGKQVSKAEVEHYRHVDLVEIGNWACTVAHQANCSCWIRARM
jgi:hypothetical protein